MKLEIDTNVVVAWTVLGALLAFFSSFPPPIDPESAARFVAWALWLFKGYGGITPVITSQSN